MAPRCVWRGQLVEIRVEARDDEPSAGELSAFEETGQHVQERSGWWDIRVETTSGPNERVVGERGALVDLVEGTFDLVEPDGQSAVHVAIGQQCGSRDLVVMRVLGGQLAHARQEPSQSPRSTDAPDQRPYDRAEFGGRRVIEGPVTDVACLGRRVTPTGHSEESADTVEMCRAPPSSGLADCHRLTGHPPEPRLAPEGRLGRRRRGGRIDLGTLDDVTLKLHAQHEPCRPVRKRRPERYVKPVEPQPVPVVSAFGHRQSGYGPHVVGVMAVVHAAVSAVVLMALAVFVMVVVLAVLAVRSVGFVSAMAVVLVMRAVSLRCRGVTVTLVVSVSAWAVSAKVVVAPALNVPCLMSPLVRGWLQERGMSLVQSMSRLPGIRYGHPCFGRRYAEPHTFRPVVPPYGNGGAGEDDEVGRSGSWDPRPAPARELGLDGQPLTRRTGSSRQQNPRPRQGRPCEARPQLHRNAPSRQA